MGGYAPDSLKWLADQLVSAIGSAELSGIVAGPNSGDSYHQAAQDLPSSSYTRQLEADRIGIDMSVSCAIDISMNPVDMKVVTGRFHASWKDPDDKRLDQVREVIGTLDGVNVTYMDCQSGEYGSADDSHLWHLHVGGLRRFIVTMDCVRAVRSVAVGETYQQYLAGGGAPSSGGSEVELSTLVPKAFTPDNKLRDVEQILNDLWRGVHGPSQDTQATAHRIETTVASAAAQLTALTGLVQTLAKAVADGGGDVETAALLAEVRKVGADAAHVAGLEQEITALRHQLAAAAKAEADVLGSGS